MAAVINIGSLNIDIVYALEHMVRPGETLSARSRAVHCGGKGANQSVALARAGARVLHAGRVGPDGGVLIAALADAGVDVTLVETGAEPSGHAVILVDDAADNAIVLYPGANHRLDDAFLDRVFATAEPGDWILLQNEVNAPERMMRRARANGLHCAFNFAPFDPAVALPLECLDMLIVNEIEGGGLAGVAAPEEILTVLSGRYPETLVVLTLGPDGALAARGAERYRAASPAVAAVDTTAAGDTFIGYFLAGTLEGMTTATALDFACRAAAIAVTRAGAAESIPERAEVG